MKVTFSDESKISFKGKSELNTECSKVTAIDFDEDGCGTNVTSTDSSTWDSLAKEVYILYAIAAADVATKAAATYFGFLFLAIWKCGSCVSWSQV